MFLKKKIEGLIHALTGIAVAWREEPNFRFHVAFALLAVATSLALDISNVELLIVLSMIGFVLAAEILNTALEELCDKFQPTHDPHVAKIKDLAAAAVFIAALTSLVVGCVIFIPYLTALFV